MQNSVVVVFVLNLVCKCSSAHLTLSCASQDWRWIVWTCTERSINHSRVWNMSPKLGSFRSGHEGPAAEHRNHMPKVDQRCHSLNDKSCRIATLSTISLIFYSIGVTFVVVIFIFLYFVESNRRFARSENLHWRELRVFSLGNLYLHSNNIPLEYLYNV